MQYLKMDHYKHTHTLADILRGSVWQECRQLFASNRFFQLHKPSHAKQQCNTYGRATLCPSDEQVYCADLPQAARVRRHRHLNAAVSAPTFGGKSRFSHPNLAGIDHGHTYAVPLIIKAGCGLSLHEWYQHHVVFESICYIYSEHFQFPLPFFYGCISVYWSTQLQWGGGYVVRVLPDRVLCRWFRQCIRLHYTFH
jgi:hypothetical protein